jgi:hypothetical protein
MGLASSEELLHTHTPAQLGDLTLRVAEKGAWRPSQWSIAQYVQPAPGG